MLYDTGEAGDLPTELRVALRRATVLFAENPICGVNISGKHSPILCYVAALVGELPERIGVRAYAANRTDCSVEGG